MNIVTMSISFVKFNLYSCWRDEKSIEPAIDRTNKDQQIGALMQLNIFF